ncbi:FGGY-family carbohydrate kinase [Roseinatronobacter alkalisoli]|uniref:FGGY-family carbohydrate kinase n=1 Tax=Roseinatronobacter alkalisoli TaxID=3028235 RepID=A0ABT5TAS1_9RHOB|nr:FGGY-family carbohydrate kinase [Roseinatronobacter sp. HJB301]MDD7972225.1 FGGY-family carbohydrate kinase [Roseinatronobacter sp. HJB301]
MTHIAVIDIGKTNAKLALVDGQTLHETAVLTRPNTVQPGPPWPHFDTEGHWRFILDGLADFHATHGVDAIAITTHGACAALLAADGSLAAPVLDYEHNGPDDLRAEYDALRPSFSHTGSPALRSGLNLGAQLFWQFSTTPDLPARVAHIVTYPQYWGFRLTGQLACDVTSLGCHTDLWDPAKGQFSSLVDRLGIGGKLAPARKPSDVLGGVLPGIAARTGLPAGLPVACGIHDSNASLLPHLLAETGPFSVVSTGTWVVAMAMGGRTPALDPARDTLLNVNARGHAVPSARFMGGREFEYLMQGKGGQPTDAAMAQVLRDNIAALPGTIPETGPFRQFQGGWTGDPPPPGSDTRAAAVGFYLALMTAECLDLIGHQGRVIVEGPFARNAAFLTMLQAVTASPVCAATGATGTSQGAALLFKDTSLPPLPACTPPPAELAQSCKAYAAAWQDNLRQSQ